MGAEGGLEGSLMAHHGYELFRWHLLGRDLKLEWWSRDSQTAYGFRRWNFVLGHRGSVLYPFNFRHVEAVIKREGRVLPLVPGSGRERNRDGFAIWQLWTHLRLQPGRARPFKMGGRRIFRPVIRSRFSETFTAPCLRYRCVPRQFLSVCHRIDGFMFDGWATTFFKNKNSKDNRYLRDF